MNVYRSQRGPLLFRLWTLLASGSGDKKDWAVDNVDLKMESKIDLVLSGEISRLILIPESLFAATKMFSCFFIKSNE